MMQINILCPFFVELTEEERLCSVFQQGSVTAHTAVHEVFGDRIVSHGHSPDLTGYGFYLWEL
jgi:hypothetical protein